MFCKARNVSCNQNDTAGMATYSVFICQTILPHSSGMVMCLLSSMTCYILILHPVMSNKHTIFEKSPRIHFPKIYFKNYTLKNEFGCRLSSLTSYILILQPVITEKKKNMSENTHKKLKRYTFRNTI